MIVNGNMNTKGILLDFLSTQERKLLFFLDLNLSPSSKMLSRMDWIQSQVAMDKTALAAGDGCHHEEAKALGDYLSDVLGTQEAAKTIVLPVLREEDPPSQLYRLWGLLSDALVELTADRRKILELLAAIQSLPSTTRVDSSQLVGFGDMWSDSYRLRLHGPDLWENESWTDVRRAELCHHFESIGRAEAGMFLHGLGGIPADWGYQVLNLVCSRRPGLDVLVSEVHAWLESAGMQLRHNLKLQEMRSYTRPVPGASRGLQQTVGCTMAEHWETWRQELLELNRSQDLLSVESRNLAAKCSTLMQ